MKPKVVLLSAFLSPLRSGAEACAEEVAKELKDDFDIVILTARMRLNLPKNDSLDDIPVHRLGLGLPFDKWLYPFLAALKTRSLQPDLVHAVLESFAGLALILCGKGFKRLLTCQSTNTTLFVKQMHQSATKITAISKTLIERAESFGRKDVVHIPNGLRLHHITPKEKIYGRVVFVGRLEPMKGIDVLLEAMKKLPSYIHLHIVGDGSLRNDLQVKTNMLGLHDRVKFIGFLPVPDVYDEFAEAQVFCGLSRSEAFGNVFIEAQAAGCAVVGTNVGGIPDTVTHGKTGLLVDPDHSEQAAEAIQDLIDHKDKCAPIIAAARENALSYDWSSIAQKYKNVYLEMLK